MQHSTMKTNKQIPLASNLRSQQNNTGKCLQSSILTKRLTRTQLKCMAGNISCVDEALFFILWRGLNRGGFLYAIKTSNLYDPLMQQLNYD